MPQKIPARDQRREFATEYALLIQALLRVQTDNRCGGASGANGLTVLRTSNKFWIDQAMHMPKVLLASELTATPDPDAPVTEISGFPNVTGKRGDLMSFSGIAHQPDEDLRLISTLGFIICQGKPQAIYARRWFFNIAAKSFRRLRSRRRCSGCASRREK